MLQCYSHDIDALERDRDTLKYLVIAPRPTPARFLRFIAFPTLGLGASVTYQTDGNPQWAAQPSTGPRYQEKVRYRDHWPGSWFP